MAKRSDDEYDAMLDQFEYRVAEVYLDFRQVQKIPNPGRRATRMAMVKQDMQDIVDAAREHTDEQIARQVEDLLDEINRAS